MVGTSASFYTDVLVGLSCTALVAFLVEHRLSSRRRRSSTETLQKDDNVDEKKARELASFKAVYLIIYAIVMGSDWLQGPYIFSLYHDEYGVPLHTVAILFVLGFLSAGVTAPFVGKWSDNFGRKRACLTFCVAYTLSCVTKFFNSLPLLALGRLLGGFSTSILFSSFESWLVSASRSRGMSQASLGQLIGRCTFVNGIVASLSGLLSDFVVNKSGTFKAPFAASGALLVLAGVLISFAWEENWGGSHDGTPGEPSPWQRSLTAIKTKPSLLVLAFVMTTFECAMYLWVFLWVPTLQDSLQPDDEPLPLGSIFSGFMVMMMLGSLLYNALLARVTAGVVLHPIAPLASPLLSPDPSPPASPTPSTLLTPSTNPSGLSSPAPSSTTSISTRRSNDERQPLLGHSVPCPSTTTSEEALSATISFHGKLLTALLLAAAAALALSATATHAKSRFYAFLLFEFTVGIYYPVIGTLRSAMLPDGCRATLCAVFRVPLNLFVTLALVTGMESRRTLVSVLSCCVLSATAVLVGGVLVGVKKVAVAGRLE